MTGEEEDLINFGTRDELRDLADRLGRERDEAREAALGMFDPVKVGQVVAQLQMERDEARDLARELMPTVRGEDPWSVRWHEQMRAKYPWLREKK